MSTDIRTKAVDFALRYAEQTGTIPFDEVMSMAIQVALFIEKGVNMEDLVAQAIAEQLEEMGAEPEPLRPNEGRLIQPDDVDDQLKQSSELIRGERRVDYNDVLGPGTVTAPSLHNADPSAKLGNIVGTAFDGAHDATSRLGFGKP